LNRNLLPLGYLAILLGVSSAASAGEFTLYDPGPSPNIKMDCAARHYAKGSWKDAQPFNLHLKVFFEEKYALLSDGNSANDVTMDLTSVALTEKNQQEYLVLNRGSATAIINTVHHDIIVVDPTSKQGEDYMISGRDCQVDRQQKVVNSEELTN
jgi:hypothetical protein